MTRKLKMLTGLLLLCMACSNVKETPKGFQYTVVRKGDGILAKPTQVLVLALTYKDAKDSTWFDSKKVKTPATVMIADTSAIKREEGIEEIFRQLSKGDSITFSVVAQKLFDKTFHAPLPPKVDPKSEFFFALGVRDIMDRDKFQKMLRDKQSKESAEQFGKDTVIIDNYLKEKNIVAQKTASGLRYIVTKPGTGPFAEKGQLLSINYAGYLLNGKYFDTNIESVAKEKNLFQKNRPYKPFESAMGGHRVISGWEEAFPLMNKGSKITVYIPSTLAYGPNKRNADIVENSILVFDMELLDIKDMKDNKPPIK
jgi:FKBP-type peptidyl-prolyl cis-trans isomerase FkpA